MQIATQVVEQSVSGMAEEAIDRKKKYDKLLAHLHKEKEKMIEDCLHQDMQAIPLLHLKHLSVTKYGLVSSHYRRQSWPKFVAAHLGIWKTTGLDYATTDDDAELHHPTKEEISYIKYLVASCEWNSTGIRNKEHSHIQHPGRRVSFHLQELAFSTDKQKDRKTLRKVLIHLKRTFPNYKPTEETCCAIALLLAVLESSSMASNVVQHLVSYQWKLPKIGDTALQERLSHILKTSCPKLREHLTFIGIESIPPIACESWIPSWFAQDIADTTLLTRIWDVLMVSHPDCILYICVSLIAQFESVLTAEQDKEVVTRKILHLPAQIEATDVEVVLFRALVWMRVDPPQSFKSSNTTTAATPTATTTTTMPEWFLATRAPTDYTVVCHAKQLREMNNHNNNNNGGGGGDNKKKIRIAFEEQFLGGSDADDHDDVPNEYPLVHASMGSPVWSAKNNKKKAESDGCSKVFIVIFLVTAAILCTLGASAPDRVDAVVADILEKNWTKQVIHQMEELFAWKEEDDDASSNSNSSSLLMDTRMGKLAGEFMAFFETAAAATPPAATESSKGDSRMEEMKEIVEAQIMPESVRSEESRNSRNMASPACDSIAMVNNNEENVTQPSLHEPVEGLLHDTNSANQDDLLDVAHDASIQQKIEEVDASTSDGAEIEKESIAQDKAEMAIELEKSHTRSLNAAHENELDTIVEDSRLDSIRLADEASQQTQTASKMAKDIVSQYLADAIRVADEGTAMRMNDVIQESPEDETSDKAAIPEDQPAEEEFVLEIVVGQVDSAAIVEPVDDQLGEEPNDIKEVAEKDNLSPTPDTTTEESEEIPSGVNAVEGEEIEEEIIEEYAIDADAVPTEAQTDLSAEVGADEVSEQNIKDGMEVHHINDATIGLVGETVESIEEIELGEREDTKGGDGDSDADSFPPVDSTIKETEREVDGSQTNEEPEPVPIDDHENSLADDSRLDQDSSETTHAPAFFRAQSIVSRILTGTTENSSDQEVVSKERIPSIEFDEPFFSKDDVTAIFEKLMKSSIDPPPGRRKQKIKKTLAHAKMAGLAEFWDKLIEEFL